MRLRPLETVDPTTNRLPEDPAMLISIGLKPENLTYLVLRLTEILEDEFEPERVGMALFDLQETVDQVLDDYLSRHAEIEDAMDQRSPEGEGP